MNRLSRQWNASKGYVRIAADPRKLRRGLHRNQRYDACLMSTEWAVDLQQVRKTYGKYLHALRGVEIRVGHGEIFGLLGPNGAGKSTLVKIMMTVVRPDAARGTILGRALGDRRAMASIGYLPEALRFPTYLTGAQVLDYYAMLALVPKRARRERAGQLLERLSMSAWGSTPISKYSKGMLQRLGIAQALMNNPQLVLLDEPTDGLDPMGRRDVRQLLQELKSEGKTVFLNSHQLSELESVCDRIAILVQGAVVRQGRLADLTAGTSQYHIRVRGDLARLRESLTRLGADIDSDSVVIKTDDVVRLNMIVDLMRSNGYLIESIEPRHLSLEDIFVEAMGTERGLVGAVPKARPVAM